MTNKLGRVTKASDSDVLKSRDASVRGFLVPLDGLNG
jgi:hypothetical protein